MALRVEAGTGKKLGQQTVVDLTAVSTTLQVRVVGRGLGDVFEIQFAFCAFHCVGGHKLRAGLCFPWAQSASQTFVRRFGSLLDFATDVVAIGGHRG